MKTNFKLSTGFIGLALTLCVTGCTHSNNEMTSTKTNEQNEYVTDINQTFKINDDLCIKHSQEIAELKNINGKPIAYYKLNQHQIPCS